MQSKVHTILKMKTFKCSGISWIRIFICSSVLLYVCVFIISFTSKLIPLQLYGMTHSTHGLSSHRKGHNSLVNYIFVRSNTQTKTHIAFKSITGITNFTTNDVVNFGSLLPPWNERNLLNKTNNQRLKAFKPTLTILEYRLFMETFKTFGEICNSYGIQYMLYGGSLVGAYRHFGLIPWDDDIDVLVNISHKTKLLNHLGNLPGYKLHSPTDQQWKFYKEETYKHTFGYGWPYIDIFFFSENGTHIWDSISAHGDVKNYCYRNVVIFPLRSMPFESVLAPVPRCSRRTLDQNYDVTICVTSGYSHKHETQVHYERTHVPCKLLYPYTLLVYRDKERRRATLKLGDDVIYSLEDDMIC